VEKPKFSALMGWNNEEAVRLSKEMEGHPQKQNICSESKTKMRYPRGYKGRGKNDASRGFKARRARKDVYLEIWVHRLFS